MIGEPASKYSHPLPRDGGRGEGSSPAAGPPQGGAGQEPASAPRGLPPVAASDSHPLPREGGRGEGSPSAISDGDGPMPVAIVGGGPVGMALALALSLHGTAAQIFEARQRAAARNDKRILALSQGSRQILDWLGVWSRITATAITTIHVSQQNGLGRTRLTAADEGVPALGYVATAASVAAALDDALNAASIPVHEHARVDHVAAAAESVSLFTGKGEVRACLVVYAEGLVEDNGAVVARDYGQHAVICTVTPRAPHGNVAYERFTAQGPLALLPHGNDMAVVYTCSAEEAAAFAAEDDELFLARLQAHFGRRMEFLAVSPRQVYPLGLRYRKSPVASRAVWLGNAAQTLHPVAGQGFNLALRDVWELARSIKGADDPGAATILARYAQRRRLDRMSVIGFTDSLIRLFSNDNSCLRHVRGLGLLALDLIPPARTFVAKRMMFGARAWP